MAMCVCVCVCVCVHDCFILLISPVQTYFNNLVFFLLPTRFIVFDIVFYIFLSCISFNHLFGYRRFYCFCLLTFLKVLCMVDLLSLTYICLQKWGFPFIVLVMAFPLLLKVSLAFLVKLVWWCRTLSFCSCVKLLISLSNLNEHLSRLSILSYSFFSFTTLNRPCHSLLAWRVSAE